MVVLILLTVLSFIIPYKILRPFSSSQKMLVMMIVAAHLVVMFAWHSRIVAATNFPIIIDQSVDCLKYHDTTISFQDSLPFAVTPGKLKSQLAGTNTYGYQYVLATLWTLTPYAILGIRLLKILLYFASLSCLARVWRTDYGSRLAMWGYAFLGVLLTPGFYYNFRNLKDGLVFSLFIFLMVTLETLLRPREKQLYPLTRRRTTWLWILVLFLLYAIATMRIYTSVMVVGAIGMHVITASKMGIKARASLVVALMFIGLAALQSGFVRQTSDVLTKEGGALSMLTGYGLLQGFLSPLPWNPLLKGYLAFFYWTYWALFPYTIYALVRHLRKNMTWQLYLYMMITYIVSGGIVGDAPRKRLIVHPIMLGWILAHLAYKKSRYSSDTYNDEIEQPYDYDEYCEEPAVVG